MSETRTMQPTERLSVTLEAQEWNMVMGACAELQRSVGTLMGKISQQAQAAQQRGNGRDTDQPFEAMRPDG
jgi:hypothetical protein